MGCSWGQVVSTCGEVEAIMASGSKYGKVVAERDKWGEVGGIVNKYSKVGTSGYKCGAERDKWGERGCNWHTVGTSGMK